jgi:hypothetical protein
LSSVARALLNAVQLHNGTGQQQEDGAIQLSLAPAQMALAKVGVFFLPAGGKPRDGGR